MRTRVRPTVFGMAVAAMLIGLLVARPSVADPSVAGLVLAGLGGALVFGVAWPIITVRTLGVRVIDSPGDLVVGQLATIEVELTGRASGLAVGAAGSATAVVDVVSPGRIRLPLTVSRRGAYTKVAIEVGSDAPFGIAWASRVREVALPRQMLVGPEVIDHTVAVADLPGQMQDPLPHGAGSTGETVRTVRPYVVGDPAHLVHWPSTARTGTLVVRELEPPAARGIAIVLDLSPDPVLTPDPPNGVLSRSDRVNTPSTQDRTPLELGPESGAEAAAGRVAGAARDARRQGARVVLCTAEHDGPVAAEAPDELAVQRRLALATTGTPASPPADWPVVVITP